MRRRPRRRARQSRPSRPPRARAAPALRRGVPPRSRPPPPRALPRGARASPALRRGASRAPAATPRPRAPAAPVCRGRRTPPARSRRPSARHVARESPSFLLVNRVLWTSSRMVLPCARAGQGSRLRTGGGPARKVVRGGLGLLLQRGVRRIVVVAVLVLAVVTVGSSAAAAATPPNTTIYNYDVYADNADFWFSSDTAKVSFQCRLDGNVFKPCVSPVSYRGLAEGTHTFEVRAVDSTGVVDATPANLTFTSTLAPPPPPAPAPDNDNWYGAQALTGTAGSVKGTTAGATTQWDEPFNPNGARHTVWYTWTAGRTANVTFTAAGDGFTPQVSVFSGSETSNAFMISTGAGSATVKTYAGLDYRISVDGVGDGTGPFALSWAFEQVGPANDYRAEAETLTGDSGSLTASNVGATVEVNEPRHDGTAGENADGHSIWYRWTAQSSGTTIFTTEGSSFDTSLRAYTESLYGGLVGQGWYLPDLNPWTTWSRLQLEVKPGETYLI